MKFDVKSKLSDCTIESKIELISFFIKRAQNKESNKRFQNLIFNYLCEKTNVVPSYNCRIIGPKDALGCFVGQFLLIYLSEDDFRNQISLLKSLSETITGIKPSKTALLKKKTTDNLIYEIVKFGLPESFLKTSIGHPLQIFLIPFQQTGINAGFYPYLNAIVCYRVREKKLRPEYVFVHEIGHLFIYKLTGDPEKVPDSFVAFNKKFNPEWEDDLVEIFVDLFSMVVMMDSEYAAHNPFIADFSPENQQIIKNYFVDLINSI